MGFFEKAFVSIPDKSSRLDKTLKWYCYIDDIFCIYQGNIDELEDFPALLNSFDWNLNFTMD